MTAILLEIVFTAALSRAFSLPLSKLITGTSPLHHGNKQVSSKEKEGTENGLLAERYSLTNSQLEIVSLVEAFAVTCSSAYK